MELFYWSMTFSMKHFYFSLMHLSQCRDTRHETDFEKSETNPEVLETSEMVSFASTVNGCKAHHFLWVLDMSLRGVSLSSLLWWKIQFVIQFLYSFLPVTEKWRESIDQGGAFGVLLTEISKAFDCLKLHGYGLDMSPLKLIYCYLSNRKQSVKINGTYSSIKYLFRSTARFYPWSSTIW